MFTLPWLLYANITVPMMTWLIAGEFQMALLKDVAISPATSEDRHEDLDSATVLQFPNRARRMPAAAQAGGESGELISFATYRRRAGAI